MIARTKQFIGVGAALAAGSLVLMGMTSSTTSRKVAVAKPNLHQYGTPKEEELVTQMQTIIQERFQDLSCPRFGMTRVAMYPADVGHSGFPYPKVARDEWSTAFTKTSYYDAYKQSRDPVFQPNSEQEYLLAKSFITEKLDAVLIVLPPPNIPLDGFASRTFAYVDPTLRPAFNIESFTNSINRVYASARQETLNVDGWRIHVSPIVSGYKQCADCHNYRAGQAEYRLQYMKATPEERKDTSRWKRFYAKGQFGPFNSDSVLGIMAVAVREHEAN